jgi:hypothetical protein
MDQLSQALDAIEASGAAPSGQLIDTYLAIRPHLSQLVAALKERGGDHARVGAVIENLMAGADSLGSSIPEDSFRNSGQGTSEDGGDPVLTAGPGGATGEPAAQI